MDPLIQKTAFTRNADKEPVHLTFRFEESHFTNDKIFLQIRAADESVVEDMAYDICNALDGPHFPVPGLEEFMGEPRGEGHCLTVCFNGLGAGHLIKALAAENKITAEERATLEKDYDRFHKNLMAKKFG